MINLVKWAFLENRFITLMRISTENSIGIELKSRGDNAKIRGKNVDFQGGQCKKVETLRRFQIKWKFRNSNPKNILDLGKSQWTRILR